MTGFVYYAHVVGEKGRVKNRVAIRSNDDREAMRLAEQLVDVDGQIVELWNAERLVARVGPSATGIE